MNGINKTKWFYSNLALWNICQLFLEKKVSEKFNKNTRIEKLINEIANFSEKNINESNSEAIYSIWSKFTNRTFIKETTIKEENFLKYKKYNDLDTIKLIMEELKYLIKLLMDFRNYYSHDISDFKEEKEKEENHKKIGDIINQGPLDEKLLKFINNRFAVISRSNNMSDEEKNLFNKSTEVKIWFFISHFIYKWQYNIFNFVKESDLENSKKIFNKVVIKTNRFENEQNSLEVETKQRLANSLYWIDKIVETGPGKIPPNIRKYLHYVHSNISENMFYIQKAKIKKLFDDFFKNKEGYSGWEDIKPSRRQAYFPTFKEVFSPVYGFSLKIVWKDPSNNIYSSKTFLNIFIPIDKFNSIFDSMDKQKELEDLFKTFDKIKDAKQKDKINEIIFEKTEKWKNEKKSFFLDLVNDYCSKKYLPEKTKKGISSFSSYQTGKLKKVLLNSDPKETKAKNVKSLLEQFNIEKKETIIQKVSKENQEDAHLNDDFFTNSAKEILKKEKWEKFRHKIISQIESINVFKTDEKIILQVIEEVYNDKESKNLSPLSLSSRVIRNLYSKVINTKYSNDLMFLICEHFPKKSLKSEKNQVETKKEYKKLTLDKRIKSLLDKFFELSGMNKESIKSEIKNEKEYQDKKYNTNDPNLKKMLNITGSKDLNELNKKISNEIYVKINDSSLNDDKKNQYRHLNLHEIFNSSTNYNNPQYNNKNNFHTRASYSIDPNNINFNNDKKIVDIEKYKPKFDDL